MGNNTVITGEIYTQAIQLIGKGYEEKPPAGLYNNCSVLIVNSEYKCFWFSTPDAAKHSMKINTLKN